MVEKTITPFEDLEFGPLGEGSPVQAALLWGTKAKSRGQQGQENLSALRLPNLMPRSR